MDRSTPSRMIEGPTTSDVVGWMQKFARKGSEDLEIRALVEKICAGLEQGDYAGECLACYYWVCQNIRYMRDIDSVEFVKEPARVLETGAGDCDDMATLLAAMFLACGNRCRFALVGFHAGKGPSHVFTEVMTPHGPITFDPVANRDTATMLKRVKARWTVNV